MVVAIKWWVTRPAEPNETFKVNLTSQRCRHLRKSDHAPYLPRSRLDIGAGLPADAHAVVAVEISAGSRSALLLQQRFGVIENVGP